MPDRGDRVRRGRVELEELIIRSLGRLQEIPTEEEGKQEELLLRKERAKADTETAFAVKESQKNKYRIPFAAAMLGVAIVWLAFTGFVILARGQDVDYKVQIAMLGTALGAIYTPLRVLAKYLFNGHDSQNSRNPA